MLNSSELVIETGGGVLRVAGTADTYTAGTLHEGLARPLREETAITVDLSGVETCDFTAIQLLHAARRSAEQAGKPFVVAGFSEAARRACAVLGLSPQVCGATGSE